MLKNQVILIILILLIDLLFLIYLVKSDVRRIVSISTRLVTKVLTRRI